MSDTHTSRPAKKKFAGTTKNGGRLGAVVAPSYADHARAKRLLAAMLAFRDGDFSVRLPSDWPGIEGRIAEAFNQTLAHEDRIAGEITRLSQVVGKEGRLKQRLS